MKSPKYQAIVVGASSGGVEALVTLLPAITQSTALPVVVVLHCKREGLSHFVAELQSKCEADVKVAQDGMKIHDKSVYLAPGGYHMLIDNAGYLRLSTDMPVKYSMPSIDVLFESSVDVFDDGLLAILLTGANDDGADGLALVKEAGGVTIAQNPNSAKMPMMPEAAIEKGVVDYVEDLDAIPHRVTMVLEGDTSG